MIERFFNCILSVILGYVLSRIFVPEQLNNLTKGNYRLCSILFLAMAFFVSVGTEYVVLNFETSIPTDGISLIFFFSSLFISVIILHKYG